MKNNRKMLQELQEKQNTQMQNFGKMLDQFAKDREELESKNEALKKAI